MYQPLLFPITSTFSSNFKIPIFSYEVDGPLLTFKFSVVTVPHPIALGFVNVIVSTLSKVILLENPPPILYVWFCSGSTWIEDSSVVISNLSSIDSSIVSTFSIVDSPL